MTHPFLDALAHRVLVFDGATGTSLQARQLTAEDFGGAHLEGCNENLVRTRPDVVADVHRAYLEAGADIIETNSFGAASVVLAEYGLEADSYELNRLAASIARREADAFSQPDRPRFVAGSVGPTTKLPSLGHISFAALRDSYQVQIEGLLDGGADLLCIETCQDPLQIKAALAATRLVFATGRARVPVIVSVTMEITGTMLMGTDIAAVLAILDPYDIVSVIGLNCATGPREMEEHLRVLATTSTRPVFAMPNAGLPENVGGHTCYRLTPEEMDTWMRRFISELGISVVGGCCGTNPDHIRALAAVAATTPPASRHPVPIPSAASLYTAVPLHLDPRPLLIGERCNANGSKQFREYLLAGNHDAMVGMAKDQIRDGAHLLDVCVAYVGRDEEADVRDLVYRFNTQVSIPLMIDSTEIPVIETALQHYGGRAIINSINLEDGEEKAEAILRLCSQYGAAVVALTIDEDGMAKTAEKKLAIAERLFDLAVYRHGLREEDLIFDVLTFTLGSGDEEFRGSAVETLRALRLIKERFPRSFTSLGVSNVSFGLAPHARHVLNSVFLHEAVEAGLDMAIVHSSKIIPMYRIDEEGRQLARKLVYDERIFETKTP